MSSHQLGPHQITLQHLHAMKERGEKIAALTCYDAAFGRLLDASQVDVVLVGDSLGNVLLGYENTLPVTMDDMVHHCRAVSRVVSRPFVIADLPFGSYSEVEKAKESAIRLVQSGRAKGVKLEGGREICEQVRSISALGIPVVGHIGLTPQSVHALSGYRVQGKSDEDKKRLLAEAKQLEEAGAEMVILELMPQALAAEITAALRIPTIGIGAGGGCDGQVLVLHDMLGFQADFQPKFLKRFENLGQRISEAVTHYVKDVKEREYPADEHSYLA